MRMRRLGDVHKLLFIASEEVVRLIVDAVGCLAADITSMEVVLWTMRESWRQAQADLPAWVQQGKSFMKREMAWQGLLDYIPHSDSSRKNKKQKSSKQQSVTWNGNIQSNFCEPEARTLDALYGVSNDLERDLVHGIDTTHEIGRLIGERCEEFGTLSIYDTTILEEMEVELMHEKEMEREVEVVPSSRPAVHAIHPDVLSFIDTGSIPLWTSGLLHIRQAFANLSIRIPEGIDQVFSNMRVTQDFCNTVMLQGPGGNKDHFLRPVEWVVTGTGPVTTSVVAFSPYEVNELLPQLKTSKAVRLHIFAPRGNLFMQPFEDLDRFVLPSNPPATPLPRALALQLNLFSGSLYLRDYKTYKDMCLTLRLHFDDLPPHLANPDIIDLSCYVKDSSARLELGMAEPGFSSTPIPFFRKILVLRRYGQNLGPSHMGRILYGSALQKGKGRDFDE
jgi:hypothetical protein